MQACRCTGSSWTRGRTKPTGPTCSTRSPVPPAPGTWWIQERGHPAPGRLQMRVETATGTEVLAASMDNHFSLLPHGKFPVYTLSNNNVRACQSYCALIWQPVLPPEPTPGRA